MSIGTSPASAPSGVMNEVVGKMPLTKKGLKALIKEAAQGDSAKIERLIAPFLSSQERLLWCGISARSGLLTTYDFAFLTDQRIGDLEVTPLTGNLNVEICYLQDIDAYVIAQPSITAKVWLALLATYPFVLWAAGVISALVATLITELVGMERDSMFYIFLALAPLVSLALLIPWTIYLKAGITRLLLHFKKSGIWLKLRATEVGTLIFADRDKFAMITSLARMMTEQKRALDRAAS